MRAVPSPARPPQLPCPSLIHPPLVRLQSKVARWLHIQHTEGKFINHEIRKSRCARCPAPPRAPSLWAGDERLLAVPA